MKALLAGLLLAVNCAASAAEPAAKANAPAAVPDAGSDRLELVLALEQRPSPSQIPILLDTLAGHESASARAEAARALALPEYRKSYALMALGRAMAKDASAPVRRQAALSAMAYEGHEAVVPLEQFLRAESAEALRREVAVALATATLHLEDSEATAAVAGLLGGEASPETRAAVAAALGRRGDRRALTALKLAADKDPEKAVRRAAREAVDALGRPPKK
jgi:HEAT repeat protein